MTARLSLPTLSMASLKTYGKNPFVVRITTVLLALIVAWQLGSLVWKVFQETDGTAPPPIATAPAGNNRSAKIQPLPNLLSHPLIETKAAKGAATPEVTSAPKTSLKLKLVGLMYSSDKTQARAIIENKKDGGKSYKTGDKIGRLAEVNAIHKDKVILLRGGRYETLPLELKTSKVKINTTKETNYDSEDTEVSLSRSTSRYLRSATRSPESFMRQFSATPATYSGHLLGFKLTAMRKPQLMEEMGLKPDDIIAAVNGTPINDPQKMMTLYEELKHTHDLTLTVINNGEKRDVSISLNE